MQKINLKPAKEVVILKDIEYTTDEDTGLALPELNKDRQKPEMGVVVSVGVGDSPFGKDKINPDDIVFYERYLDNRISYKGHRFNYVRFNKILAIIPKKP